MNFMKTRQSLFLFFCCLSTVYFGQTNKIKVYFNHPVSTQYANSPQNHAVNVGTKMVDTLISYINKCDSTLDIAIYNSYSANATTGLAGAINAAYSRGVKVRVIYDGGTSSTMVNLLNNNIPRLASPTTADYTIMHNKFVVFNGKCVNPNLSSIWTGSTNWTSAQIDGPDKNNSIWIQSKDLARAYTTEFEEMWGSTTMTPNSLNSKFGQFKTNNTLHNFTVDGIQVESYFSPSDGTNSKILSAINSANRDLHVAMLTFTRDDLANAIVGRKFQGVDNNIILDQVSQTGDEYTYLVTNLGPNKVVRSSLSGQMHHKFMVVDNYAPESDPIVLTGSHNWSTSAETKNDENTIIVHDANIANQYFQAFAYLFEISQGEMSVATVEEIDFNEHLSIYPNPAVDELFLLNTLPSKFQIKQLLIRDLTGKFIRVENVFGEEVQKLDIADLALGVYVLTLEGQNFSHTIRFIKQ